MVIKTNYLDGSKGHLKFIEDKQPIDNNIGVTFDKFVFTSCFKDKIPPILYRFRIKDMFTGFTGEKPKFLSRLKRAWKNLCGSEITYTSLVFENEREVRKFLLDALKLLEEEELTGKQKYAVLIARNSKEEE